MNYYQFFKDELNKLKDEGNYRVFADLEKIAGNFPQALNYKEDNDKHMRLLIYDTLFQAPPVT